MMVIPENERSGTNPTQNNQKQGNHANALVLLQTHPSQDGNRVERLKEIDAANLKFITCFFLCFFLSLFLPRSTSLNRKANMSLSHSRDLGTTGIIPVLIFEVHLSAHEFLSLSAC